MTLLAVALYAAASARRGMQEGERVVAWTRTSAHPARTGAYGTHTATRPHTDLGQTAIFGSATAHEPGCAPRTRSPSPSSHHTNSSQHVTASQPRARAGAAWSSGTNVRSTERYTVVVAGKLDCTFCARFCSRALVLEACQRARGAHAASLPSVALGGACCPPNPFGWLGSAFLLTQTPCRWGPSPSQSRASTGWARAPPRAPSQAP